MLFTPSRSEAICAERNGNDSLGEGIEHSSNSGTIDELVGWFTGRTGRNASLLRKRFCGHPASRYASALSNSMRK